MVTDQPVNYEVEEVEVRGQAKQRGSFSSLDSLLDQCL